MQPTNATSAFNWFIAGMQAADGSGHSSSLIACSPRSAGDEATSAWTAAWLAEMVRSELMNRYGREVTTRGFLVTTTIDSDMQRAANYAVRDGLLEYDRRHGYRGPLAQVDLDALTAPEREQTLADYPVVLINGHGEYWSRWPAAKRPCCHGAA